MGARATPWVHLSCHNQFCTGHGNNTEMAPTLAHFFCLALRYAHVDGLNCESMVNPMNKTTCTPTGAPHLKENASAPRSK